MTAARTLIFGDLNAGVWGGIWAPASDRALAQIGTTDAGTAATGLDLVELAGTQATGRWDVRGAAGALSVEASGPAVDLPDAGGFAELCRVTGTWSVAGESRPLDLAGCRSVHHLPDGYESLRHVSGWTGNGDGFAVMSVRPRRAKGHDRDAITGALFESDGAYLVAEPRLSTTMASAGRVRRAGLELWLLAEDDVQEGEADSALLYPRRAAGEALGPAFEGAPSGGAEVTMSLLRWHLRGREGLGAYLLGRPR